MALQWKNGWMDTHNVYRTIIKKSCNVLKVNQSGKNSMRCQKYAKKEDHIDLKFNPSTNTQHNGKCNICAFHEEIHAFEDRIFVRLSSPVLAFEWTTNRNKFIVQWIDFNQFMMSEGSYKLILPFTSKTGQSVAQNRQKIF